MKKIVSSESANIFSGSDIVEHHDNKKKLYCQQSSIEVFTLWIISSVRGYLSDIFTQFIHI